MAKGFKRDAIRTAEIKWLQDHRSFISLPKIIPGECAEPKAHLILYGKDKAPIRAEIFRRNRKANGGVNLCWNCGRCVLENEDSPIPSNIYFAPVPGQWHHLRNKDGERCDCPENGAVSCGECHKQEHPRPMWTKDMVNQ